MVRAKDRPVPGEVVEVVHNHRHEQVENEEAVNIGDDCRSSQINWDGLIEGKDYNTKFHELAPI